MALVERLLPIIRSLLQPVSFWILALLIVTSPIWLTVMKDGTGPSTSYFNQRIVTAREDADGNEYLYPGDRVEVRAGIIRHHFNGTCHLMVYRVRENIGGKYDGEIHLMQQVEQEFIGDGLFRHTSWPIAPEQIIVTPQWIEDPATSSQTVDLFVIGHYYCNFLDFLVPRFLHSADGPLPAGFLVRNRRLVGFSIPGWDPHSGYEGGHSRVIIERKEGD